MGKTEVYAFVADSYRDFKSCLFYMTDLKVNENKSHISFLKFTRTPLQATEKKYTM